MVNLPTRKEKKRKHIADNKSNISKQGNNTTATHNSDEPQHMFVDVDTRAAVQSKPATMVCNYKQADWKAMRDDMKNFSLLEINRCM